MNQIRANLFLRGFFSLHAGFSFMTCGPAWQNLMESRRLWANFISDLNFSQEVVVSGILSFWLISMFLSALLPRFRSLRLSGFLGLTGFYIMSGLGEYWDWGIVLSLLSLLGISFASSRQLEALLIKILEYPTQFIIFSSLIIIGTAGFAIFLDFWLARFVWIFPVISAVAVLGRQSTSLSFGSKTNV